MSRDKVKDALLSYRSPNFKGLPENLIFFFFFERFTYLIINSKWFYHANFINLEDGDAKQVVIFSPSIKSFDTVDNFYHAHT